MKYTISLFGLFLLLTPFGVKSEVDLTQYKGKVVYLDFWASWCEPCRESFPWMNEVANRFKEHNFKIVAVNVDRKKNDALFFLEQNPADFDIKFDPSGKTAEKFGVKGMPSSVLINREGKVIYAHTGFFNSKKKQYEKEILDLIKEAK